MNYRAGALLALCPLRHVHYAPSITTSVPGRANLYRACVLLVVACPCALVISTPVTYVSALAHCAQEGILVKGGSHLETLGRVQVLAMDKTGTLTERG